MLITCVRSEGRLQMLRGDVKERLPLLSCIVRVFFFFFLAVLRLLRSCKVESYFQKRIRRGW